MSKKVIVLIVLALAATLFITACTLSASNAPQATPTEAGSTSLPTGISLVEVWGTTTAAYLQTAEAQGFTQTPTITPENQTLVPPTGAAPGTINTPAVISVPTSTPGRPATYTLQKGEFPYCIARRFDVDPAQLLSMNGLTNNQLLQPGLQLTIPSTGSFPGTRALRAHPTTYTVQLDDTIFKVACYFGDLDPTAIAAANGLALTSPLTTGQSLLIP